MTASLVMTELQQLSDGLAGVIYLDHAATTPMCEQAVSWMSVGHSLYGNPSSTHWAGQATRDGLATARGEVAKLFGCPPEEIVFTSGGSEAINLALYGTFAARGWRGHLVTSAIEHSATLKCVETLRERGVTVTVVPPTTDGHVTVEAIAEALRDDTVLVSIMHANNEIGTIQPVDAITELAHSRGIAVHVDAVQTAGKLPIDHLAAELISISAHKFGGPKGVGALRLSQDHALEPIIRGGSQENGRRAGTENIVGIMGMGGAAAQARQRLTRPDFRRELEDLRELLLAELNTIPGVRFNGTQPQMAETVSVSIAGVRGDALADQLDALGICVSTGSACHAGSADPSHVLAAIGLDTEAARSTLRFSLSSSNLDSEMLRAAAATAAAVERLRALSCRQNPYDSEVFPSATTR